MKKILFKEKRKNPISVDKRKYISLNEKEKKL